jgi:hypothetical protein
MKVVLDRDVESAVAILQENFEASRLVGIASGVNLIAPLLWGRYLPEPVQAIQVVRGGITSSPDGQHKQLTAT